jgi:hypothetical protein
LTIAVLLVHGRNELRIALCLCLRQAVENAGAVAQHLAPMLLESVSSSYGCRL